MLAISLETTVIFFLVLGNGCSTPVVEYDKSLRYEEYTIEHEISSTQARNSALTTDLESIVPAPGCQECTYEEKRYCLGADFINDHCCCDKRYELLPYVPHTCYFGNQLCTPVMSSCDQYSRLRICCCDKFVLEKWKEKFKNSGCKTTSRIIFTLILSQIVYMFVNYFIV
ncbi:uncharacterized protein LOC108911509 [Anoplophora glabripennis]|uniref:uncharacterized protein LOC108911509 n=1 Tax=Anoplophora glabripennis TaxID=217634 RepID=UPI000873FB58|nr:uncharacterized protein LOC108911509 [Anoplophora glabripennis]XP_018571981.1 uncharacterized protein LOC108911509 [Anoplophora glabripennis]